MIIDLPSTNSSKINRALVDLREKGGSITLGRVLTLVIITDDRPPRIPSPRPTPPPSSTPAG